MDLAPELRLMICEYALAEDHPIVVPPLRELPAPPLLGGNSQIRSECMQRGYYYRNNSFHVVAQDKIVRWPASFCEDATEHFTHVPSLTFEIRFSEHLMHMLRMAVGKRLPQLAPKRSIVKPRNMRLKVAIDAQAARLQLFMQSGLPMQRVQLTSPFLRGEININDDSIASAAMRSFHTE